MRVSWNQKLIKLSQKILRKHTKDQLNSALVSISQIAGTRVSESALRAAFTARGLGSPTEYLKKPELALDLLEQHERHGETVRSKQQVKRLLEELREANARQAFLNTISNQSSVPHIIAREKTSGIRELTAVVLASDWHVEEPVIPESVAYRNEFNLEIAAKRIKRYFQGIIWNVEHQRASGLLSIKDLVLWLGGDLMSGYIHEELVETAQLSPTETVCWLMPHLKNGIISLLDVLKLEHLEIPCSFGNHARTTLKPRISTGYKNSYEWLMYHVLAASFKDDQRVHFEITNSAHQYVQVYNHVLHFHHGDDIKFHGGVGGIGIPLMKALPQWDLIKRSDIHNIGHFHSFLDYGRVVVNGSLIGYGPYSQRIRASYESPTQAMYYVDKVRGKCMVTALWLDDEDSYKAFEEA